MKHQVGKHLKMIRTRKKMSSEEAAQRCGLNRSSYSRIETGNKIPKLDELEAIAGAMNTTVGSLLGVKLSPDVQRVVDVLDGLPESSRVHILGLLESGVLNSESRVQAIRQLLDPPLPP